MNNLNNSGHKRLILTSTNQILELVKNNQEIQKALPRLAAIANQQENQPQKKTCACKKNITVVDASKKQLVEDALNSLTSQDFLKIKNILQLDQLCYYKRNFETKALELICI